MSLIVRIKGANFANADRPKLAPYRYGFPKTNLQGLYLMEEGVDGVQHAGTFLDSSGNNNHATLKGTWTQPTKRSYGMELAANGVLFNTPFTLPQKFSLIVALKTAVEATPVSSTRYFDVFTRSGAASLGVTNAAASNNLGTDTRINTEMVITSGNSDWGIYSPPGWTGTSSSPNTTRYVGPFGAGKQSSPSLIGLSYDGVTGAMTIKMPGQSFTAQNAGRFDFADTLALGLFPYAAGQAPSAGAQFYMAGVWADSSVTLLDEVMGVAKARIEARGIVLATS